MGAFSMGEMTSCAPFLALEPIAQLATSAAILPAFHLLLGLDFGNDGKGFGARHALAVLGIAQGIFCLSQQSTSAKRSHLLPGANCQTVRRNGLELPVGSRIIMFNCCLYCITCRLDKLAIQQAGSIFVFFAFDRLVMAPVCLLGGAADAPQVRRGSSSRLAAYSRPPVAACLLAVCAIETIYMLSLFTAVSLISPVFVTSVKRGGGVVFSALLGRTLFGEQLAGRQ